MLHDRPYQTEAVQSLWDYFARASGNPIVAMPTGTGKSVVIARFLQSAFAAWPRQKILILTHVKELIQQNFNKLKDVWPFAPAGIYSAGLNLRDLHSPIVFAGIASIFKRAAELGKVDLIIIDEVHLVSPNDETMYQTFIAALRAVNPFLKIIGFTATPWRLGHGKLTEPHETRDGIIKPSIFTDFCFDITGMDAFNRLIAEGYLIPLVPRPTQTKLDTDGVHTRGGEFIESELQRAVDKDEITWAALQEAIVQGENRRKWLIFAAGIDHAEHIGEALNTLGIPCGVVHSKRDDRDAVLAAHKAGELRAVVNNNVLTTGYDDPEIDMILCLRPTLSTVLWVQMLGRGTRPLFAPGYDLNTIDGRLAAIAASGKLNCKVLDYAANTRKLGPINDPVIPRRKGKGGGPAPVKECEACGNFVHASLRYCNAHLEDGTVCGHEFQFETKLMQGASSQELIKGELPLVETFKVDYITVTEHTKSGVPPMARVTYYSGTRSFQEIICFEHTNYGGRRAREWWRQRSDTPFPTSTAEGIARIPTDTSQPTHLRVWVNKKPYQEIMSYCYDGSDFGKDPPGAQAAPQVSIDRKHQNRIPDHIIDEDIPF